MSDIDVQGARFSGILCREKLAGMRLYGMIPGSK
jgi:hypothetical protein